MPPPFPGPDRGLRGRSPGQRKGFQPGAQPSERRATAFLPRDKKKNEIIKKKTPNTTKKKEKEREGI